MHIGLDKCGSSALQSALSENPVQKLHTSEYDILRYVTINNDGKIMSGEALSTHALCTPSQYASSQDLVTMDTWTDEIFTSIGSQLFDISNGGKDLLVFSCELWAYQANNFQRNHFFKRLKINSQAVCYVRNPVDWINSAWWQWGAWSEYDLDIVIQKFIHANISQWSIRLEEWQELLGAESVTIKLLPKDIVSDFNQYIGIEVSSQSKSNRINSSLPAAILRFYQKHRELRPTIHNSSIDFILSNALDFDETFEKTPWVLDRNHIEYILKETRESNQKLIQMLDKGAKNRCLSDTKWWDADAFNDKKLSPSICKEECLSYENIDHLLLQSFKSIKELSLENLKLKAQLQKTVD